MSKRKGLREIEWGIPGDPDQTCIYDNGHQDPEKFLAAVKEKAGYWAPGRDVIDVLTVDDVCHIRFRPMSPSEARSNGVDYGVVQEWDESRGYPVTAVII